MNFSKKIIINIFFLLINNLVFSITITQHTKNCYTLLPNTKLSSYYIKLLNSFPVNTCFQGYCTISKDKCKKTSKEVFMNLEKMGGYEGVRYFDSQKKDFNPIFKESLVLENNDLFIKDKNFGKMFYTINFNVENTNNCAILATLNKNLINPLFWEIKKDEFSIFVLTNENENNIELYVLIQTSYKINWFLKSRIENAFYARIYGIQDWFIRMITNE